MKTGRDKISLAGWSRSMFRFGLYAAQHPDKIERLAIVGPGYRRDAPSEFPIANTPSSGPSRTSAPQFSFFLRTADDILAPWARQRRCEDTFDPGVHEALANAVHRYADPGAVDVGDATWDVLQSCQWHAGGRWMESHVGIARDSAGAPGVGEHDPRSAEEVPNLYADIGSSEKILLTAQCATHFLLFERNHKTVHNAFGEFLTKGTVDGRQGVMTVDRNGNYVPAPQTVVYTNDICKVLWWGRAQAAPTWCASSSSRSSRPRS